MFFIGDREYMISAERSAVVHPGVPLRAEFSRDFEQLLLRIDESALARKLSALVETPIDSKIEIVPRHEDGTGFAALQRLVSYLAGEISAPDTALAAPALAELEQAVLVAFLYANPNLFSKLLNRKPCSIAPWQVVRAEEYIEANWNSVLTIESLAEAIGASARSIFLSFQKARGYSPMAFAKMTRLRHARRKLSTPEADTTVTGVAFECGFQNTGHFAMSYRKHFGESPSETLRTAKARG